MKEFALPETTFNPFHPHIPACSDSENEKGSDEEERLEVVGTDSLSAEKYCANELVLRHAEAGAKNDHKTATIGCTRRLSVTIFPLILSPPSYSTPMTSSV